MTPIQSVYFILLFPLVGSLIALAIGRENEKIRDKFNVLITSITFIVIASLYSYVRLETIDVMINYITGFGLHIKIDMFRYILIFITSLIWFLITLYSTQYLKSYKNKNRYYIFFMLTMWSTICIFICDNLINIFTFFEVMSIASYPLIIHDENEYAHEAGDTYIVIAVAGGLVTLMGLFMLYSSTHTLEISELRDLVPELGNIKYVISTLIIVGFAVKAGMLPLHVWLPKAHPAAPAPASAILSGVLLKTGIFGILITSQILMVGDIYICSAILILGFLTMFFGGFLALFQRNIKRILAYSSMSQMGYILVGIGLIGMLGEHGATALYGVVYHIINHMIYKVLLFMGVGIVYMVLHELSINKTGGFGKNKKILTSVFLIGMCGIMGIPGFNGFASKTLLHHALSKAKHLYGGFGFAVAETIFVISSAFTVAYLLKIFFAVFIEESEHIADKHKTNDYKKALIPMIVLATLVIVIGINPSLVMHFIDDTVHAFDGIHILHEINFLTVDNIKSSAITLLLGVLIYIVVIRKVLRKGSGKHWWYENIAQKWFAIEKHIYIPVGKFIISLCSIVLNIADVVIDKIAIWMVSSLNTLVNKQIKVKSTGVISNTIPACEMCFTYEDSTSTSSVKDFFAFVYSRISSVTYSIFLYGVVLITSLTVLISFKFF